MEQVFNCNVQFAKNGGKKVRQKTKLTPARDATMLKGSLFRTTKQMRDRYDIKAFVMAMDSHEITVEDVLNSLWDDWGTIEVAKLRATRKARVARVKLAFNQLFLAGKVKMGMGRPDLGPDYNTPRTFDDYKAWRIERCRVEIQRTKESLTAGNDNILARCWLGNLEDYLEGYQQTEILERRTLSKDLVRFWKPRGALLCVGQLSQDCWPHIIVKLDNSDCVLQGRLF